MDLSELSLSLHSGAVASDGNILVIAVEEEKADHKVEHAHLLIHDGQDWSHLAALDFSCVRVVWRDGREPCWIVLGVNGQIVTCSRRDATVHTPIFPRAKPGKMGIMSSLRIVGERVYAVGMRRQVFSSDESLSMWTNETDALAAWPALGDVDGFEAIGGIDESLVIVAGWNGEIAVRSHGAWRRMDSPTNFILYGVCVAETGDLWAVGQGGILLRGQGNTWKMVGHGVPKEDFWDIAWYRGQFHASTLRSVFVFDAEGHATRLDMEDATTSSCYHLSVAGDHLCSIGPHAISHFDGETWIEVLLP